MDDDLKIRQHIPDKWVENSHCVLCGFSPQKIERKGQEPDQIKCPRCGLSIVMDETGQYVCISCLPAALQGAVTARWMKVPDLIDYLKRAYSSKIKPEPPVFKNFTASDIDSLPTDYPLDANPQPKTNNTKDSSADSNQNIDELTFKTKALYDLGNPSWKIKKILKDTSKFTDDQINASVQNIENQEKQKANRGALRISAILLAVMVSCGLIAGIFIYLTSAFSSNIHQANQAVQSISTQVSNARTENPPILPQQVQTLIPPGVNIINVPTPDIIKLSPGAAVPVSESTAMPAQSQSGSTTRRYGCPKNSKDAASLFGGNQNNWSLQQNQWVMLDNNGATINLPQGMSAGYLVISSGMEIKSVSGPAQMTNIYMVMISCN